MTTDIASHGSPAEALTSAGPDVCERRRKDRHGKGWGGRQAEPRHSGRKGRVVSSSATVKQTRTGGLERLTHEQSSTS